MGARVIVHESIAEELTAKFVAKASSIRCGDPTLISTQMGPVITKAQLDKVVSRHCHSSVVATRGWGSVFLGGE